MRNKVSPLSFTRDEFCQEIFYLLGKGKRHAAALYSEWYQTGVMTEKHRCFNQSPHLFQQIMDCVDLSLPREIKRLEQEQVSKSLLAFEDGESVECVALGMKNGWTLCVSSQVGCRMGCAFCETGKMGLTRHLKAEEIVGQVFFARHVLKVPVRNIVFMGMGEPFDNFDAVIHAIRVLCDQGGMALAERRITVSTSGLVSGIDRLAELKSPVPNLAVSINASNNDVRKKIMPVTRRHSLEQLKVAMERYCLKQNREVFVEYVLLKDVNDSLESAKELIDFLTGIAAKVNVIPYNPQENSRFSAPDLEMVDAFVQELRLKGLRALVRHNKGQEILAACGQLSRKTPVKSCVQ